MAQKSKNNNKMNMNMPRPSFLWIYGLIGAFILGYYFFNPTNDQPIKSDWTLVGSMIAQGDVERVQIVGESRALIFLKKGAVEKYRNAPENKNKQLGSIPDNPPQLFLITGPIEPFIAELNKVAQEAGYNIPIEYLEPEKDTWTSILINLLPWIIIIGAWFFIMRSMSRGAGAGGGGGIMNVGKAKAQVFDKDNSKRVT